MHGPYGVLGRIALFLVIASLLRLAGAIWAATGHRSTRQAWRGDATQASEPAGAGRKAGWAAERPVRPDL